MVCVVRVLIVAVYELSSLSAEAEYVSVSFSSVKESGAHFNG